MTDALIVKVDRGRVWIERGHQSFMLAYDDQEPGQLEWYAGQLRRVLAESREPDAAGAPKLSMTVLENVAVDACNAVKAWADSDRHAPFPESAHMLVEAVLMLATQRRKGVR